MVLVTGELSEEMKEQYRKAYPDVEIEIRVLVPAAFAGKDIPQLYERRLVVPEALASVDIETLPDDIEHAMSRLVERVCFA